MFHILLFSILISSIYCTETVETSHPESDRIYGKYIELSMELTILLKDSGIEERKIHDLCKDLISNPNDEEKQQKILDKFMDKLPEEQKKIFGELYFDKIKLDYITKKVHRVLGFYLTKHQIGRLRDVIQSKIDSGATRADLVEAMVEELCKEISREKAVKAIESTMRDLKIFGKKNPGWIEKVEKMFHHIIVHDEM